MVMANVERIREQYPKGTVVRLLEMNDPQAPPAGCKGTVTGVDDAGDLLMRWDNGSSLKIILSVDDFEVIEKPDSM